MNDIFKLISNQLENKLLNELSKDFPELSEEDLKNFIYKKTREHFDFNKSNILYKNRIKGEEEEILDNLFPGKNEWKTRLIKRYGQDKNDTYYIMIEYFKVFKNKTINNNVNMNKLELFKETYKQVFQPYHTKENASVWKQKKFRLKKKMLADNPDILDYEYIMFDKLQQFISI